MKTLIRSLLFLSVISLVLGSCELGKSGKTDIAYQSIDKEYVLIRDVQLLQQSDDDISEHVDSILTGLINEEFVSTGRKDFNLDENPYMDIGFEIIDLNGFNPRGLPESFDSLAARVDPLSVEILDNSTYGYPDALQQNSLISEEGHWSDRTSLLGTFMNAGQFQGMGDRYLGFRIPVPSGYQYGWIKLYVSQHNDTLRIIEYAYDRVRDNSIVAGQKE